MAKADRARANGLKALKTVEDVLTDIGWDPQPTETEGMLRIDFSSDDIPIAEALASVRIDFERFVFYLIVRDRAPAKHRAQVMEFVTRANFDLVTGNFELNLADGMVRFKSSIDFTRTTLNATLVRDAIRSAMDAVEMYASALVSVMRGKMNALDAIEDAEGGLASDDA